MEISGLQKTTLLDYPGKVACTVFLSGCNLRCPFCHNAGLVLRPGENAVTEADFFAFLEKRRGILDGVCVTGGEPTLRRELPEFLAKLREMGFLVKLDTNGTDPDMLRQVLPLVDYVAMDIKAAPADYKAITGGMDVLDQVRQSARLLMHSAADYEFRTTCVAPFHTEAAMEAIGQWLAGARRYYLQKFVDSGDLIGSGMSQRSKEEMEALRQAVLPYIANTHLRGI